MSFTKLTFAGHSAVLIEDGDKVVAIDPWLEGNPSCPDELKNPEQIDTIVLTHGHADHASGVPGLAKQLDSQVAATYELANIMISEGVPESNVHHMNKGGTVEIDGVSVTLTHAMHSNSYDTEDGPVYAGEACGVILGDGEKVIYHAGDTALFADMELIGKRYLPDVALLPIGDRFTMGPEEAAQAAMLLGTKLAIPIHYDTFPILTGTTEHFKRCCDELSIKTAILAPGESLGLE